MISIAWILLQLHQIVVVIDEDDIFVDTIIHMKNGFVMADVADDVIIFIVLPEDRGTEFFPVNVIMVVQIPCTHFTFQGLNPSSFRVLLAYDISHC